MTKTRAQSNPEEHTGLATDIGACGLEMDSWTLQGDSYSFLRSAPRNFSLCHRDGTPNHVEIFDIINAPSQRSVISETTCLCDIFVDNTEAASLSSSPSSSSFTPRLTEVEERAVTSPSVDDLNDSSGSYHTAQSSSEGEEGLEDPSETQNCTQLQSLEQVSELPGIGSSPHCRIYPDLQTVSEGISFESETPETEACQSSTSSLADIRCSTSPANSGKSFSKTGSRNTTPVSQDRHSSLSHHTPSPEPRNCVSSSSSPSLPTQPDLEETPLELETLGDKSTSGFPELLSSCQITPSNFLPKIIISSTSILHSPCPEPRGRISVPDLLSRGSTPESDDPSQTGELISNLINDQEDIHISGLEDINLPEETIDTVPTPDLQCTSPSPVTLLTPSPEPGRLSISSEIGQNSPPNRLSPSSPDLITGVRSPTTPESRTSLHSPVISYRLSPSPASSPVVCITEAVSPEIRIISSSPEIETHFESPILESHPLPLEPPASPQFTKISYSIVQPEDQPATAFSQDTYFPSPPKSRECSPIRDSLPNSLESELVSQQCSEDRDKTSSPDSGNHSPLYERSQRPSLNLLSRNISPVTPALEQPTERSPVEDFESSYRDTFVGIEDLSSIDIVEIKDSIKPASPLKLQSEDSEVVITEIGCVPPVLAFSAGEETTETTNTNRESQSSDILGLNSDSETNHTFTEGKDVIAPSSVVNHPLTNPTLAIKNNNTNLSPIHKETTDSSDKDLENPQPLFTNFSQSPKSNRTFNPNLTPKPFRRQLSGAVENKIIVKESMASHVKKRRTPSPPLTRFTPVHIIAPEKPYRQWQNRGHSPPKDTSLHNAKLKKVVTNTQIPSCDPVNNSQGDWFRKGRQQELEKGQEPQERAIDQELRDCGMYRERKREECKPEKGEGWHGDASYREEQVELSFNTKNRKGPVSRSTTVTSRDTRPSLPTVHSSSENLLTRQSKQQQTLHRLSSQPDSKSGNLGRRLQPAITQHKGTTSGRAATNRPGRSSSSSMGSELDEADHEVKWFSDVAFSSLSSPEVDYLDMYNSSHRSSTNVSQPSTQDSPAGGNTPWLSYADFSGSAMLDNDDLALQQTSAYYSDGLDSSRGYELASFECVDVAVEKEDARRVRRGVPKRQIQLKRRDTVDSKQDESSETSSPGVPLIENPSQDTNLRQHCIPASSQDSYRESPELDKHLIATKSKLQKSSSFEESCAKTKIATCLIKSVLTKKMQNDELEESGGLDENSSTTKTELSKSPRPEELCSSLQSDCSLTDVTGGRYETNIKDNGKKKNIGGKFSQRPSSTNSNKSVTFSIADSEEAEVETRSAALQSPHKETFSEEVPDDSQMWQGTESDVAGDDTANTSGNTSSVSTASSIGHVRMMDTDQECENTLCIKQAQHDIPSSYTSKSPTNLSLALKEKRKASLNVCLTPEADNKSFISEEKSEACVDGKIKEEEIEDKVKNRIHKVRDVRRLVKNTYNLSFKAANAISTDERDSLSSKDEIPKENKGDVTPESLSLQEDGHRDTRELKEEVTDNPGIHEGQKNNKQLPQQKEHSSYSQSMKIECKAVCWKDNKSKTTSDLKNITELKPLETETSQNAKEITGDGTDIDAQSESVEGEFTERQHTSTHQRADRPVLASLPKMPSKEREVSTAIVLIRENSWTKKSASPSQEDSPGTLPASSPGLSGTPGSSGHSVSMLLKEKGYQADIGAVVGENPNAGASKNSPSKHVNCLEIPLQTKTETHRERTLSSSSTNSGHLVTPGNTDTKIIMESKMVEAEEVPSKVDPTNKIHSLPPKPKVEPHPANKHTAHGDFEAVKRLDPTFPPRSPAVRKFKPQPIEVKSTSTEMNKHDTSTSGSSRPQAIEVKSVAKKSQKPIVPPKPNCKFKPLDLGAMPSEPQSLPPTSSKSHNEDRMQTIVVSSPTIYRKIPNDSTSNYTRKVAVSSVSSLKSPSSKPPLANVSTQASSVETNAVTDRQQRQQPPSQSSRYTQRNPTLHSAPTTTSGPTISSSALSDATGHQPQAPALSGATQISQTAALDSNTLPYICMPYPHEPATMGPSDTQHTPVVTVQGPGFTRQPYHRSFSNECSQRRDDLHFYASDDPPSYDERESFSPLRLPDLPPRSNRYQPPSLPPPCSCSSGCLSHPGLPHPHSNSHIHTPPAPTHSPGHAVHYPVSQPSLRPHHCRPDPQPMTYQPSSPKASPLGTGPPQGIYQSLHQPPACPPHPSLMHAYSAERPLQPAQPRPPVHRSPQQPPPIMTGAPYTDPGHSHSPGLPHLDPHYLCGTQNIGPSFGSEYGGDNSSIYSESSYGQTPRRVLMDPETGKYFYIEVPIQPLRKMLFDPETGQYVEVLIPQQAMSHSSIYPSSAPNYPPIHSTNMYAPAPQYMPYAAPPAHAQPPRYPEPSAAAPMHPHGPGVSYRNPSGQGSKVENQNHPPVDPNYLESMYYVPTGMNASPNTTPPDYYHKHPPNPPPGGGKRS